MMLLHFPRLLMEAIRGEQAVQKHLCWKRIYPASLSSFERQIGLNRAILGLRDAMAVEGLWSSREVNKKSPRF